MKYILSAICLILSFGLAQNETPGLSLAAALSAAQSRSDVVNAQLALNDAQIALNRTLADPLALKVPTVQAQQRVALSKAQLNQAQYQAIADITAAYTQLLEAQAGRDLSAFGLDLSKQSLQIAKIRFEKGSATELEVQEAQNSVDDAEKNLSSAEQGAALAKTNLAGLIGQSAEMLEPIPDSLLISMPALDTVLANLDQLPSLLQVSQGLELASLGVEQLDPSYASQSQIDNAKLQLSQAQTSGAEARRGLELQARSLYNQAQTAFETLKIRQDALDNALQRETLEKQRLDAGLIADIQFKQTQLSTMQAQLAALQAKHGYLNALLDLQAGTMTPLEGLNAF